MKYTLCGFSDEAGRSIEEQAEVFVKNSITYMEMRSVEGVNVLDMKESDALKYSDYLKRYGIKVFSIGSPIGKCKFDERGQNEKNLRKIQKIAEIFGAKHIRIFSFYVKKEEKSWMNYPCADVINRLCNISSGFKLCHENESGIFGEGPCDVEYLLDKVGKLCQVFDPGNYVQCGYDIDKCINRLYERIEYVHVKDYSRSLGKHMPAGMGDGEIEKLLSLIRKDTFLSIEPHLKVFDGYAAIDSRNLKSDGEYPTAEQAFTAAADALKNILKNLGFEEKERGEWIK